VVFLGADASGAHYRVDAPSHTYNSLSTVPFSVTVSIQHDLQQSLTIPAAAVTLLADPGPVSETHTSTVQHTTSQGGGTTSGGPSSGSTTSTGTSATSATVALVQIVVAAGTALTARGGGGGADSGQNNQGQAEQSFRSQANASNAVTIINQPAQQVLTVRIGLHNDGTTKDTAKTGVEVLLASVDVSRKATAVGAVTVGSVWYDDASVSVFEMIINGGPQIVSAAKVSPPGSGENAAPGPPDQGQPPNPDQPQPPGTESKSSWIAVVITVTVAASLAVAGVIVTVWLKHPRPGALKQEQQSDSECTINPA
jgi:flagellar basal body-associated protein FliL